MNQSQNFRPPCDLTNRSGSTREIKLLTTDDGSRWDAYVRTSADGSFYHLAGWRNIIEKCLAHPTYYLYCELDGEIDAVLPLVHVKSLFFGNALISVPFLVYGGPIAASRDSLNVLINYAKELADDLSVDYLEFRNLKPLEGHWSNKDTYVTFRKRIEEDPESNLRAIPRKQRAMIRKGIKAGLKADRDDDTERLFAAMLVCKRNLGTPFFGANWLQAIKDEFGKQVEITTVTHKQTLICSVMSFRYGNTILPYYGGGGDVARELKGNDFMYWAVLEQACLDRIDIFDFGRSNVGSGAYRFKKHWGFEPQALPYQFHLVNADTMPNLNPSNPRYRMLIGAWKKLPLAVAATVGPHIARRLG